MSFFNQFFVPRLYVAETVPGDRGWLAFVLPEGVTPPGTGLELDQAFPGPGLQGSFVISATAPAIGDADQAQAFVDAVTAVLSVSPASRGFLWLTDPKDIRSTTVPLMGIDGEGTRVATALEAPIIPQTLALTVSNGMSLTLPAGGTVLQIAQSQQGQEIQFSGSASPKASPVLAGTLPFSGPERGVIQFSVFLERQSLYDAFNWGFQFLFPVSDPVRPALSQWYPLASGSDPVPTDKIGFAASIDPSDPLNQSLPDRTVLTFTGQNQDGAATVLASYYRTSSGTAIDLLPVGESGSEPQPASFIFTLGVQASGQTGQEEDFQAAPAGDFVLSIDGAAEGEVFDLLCGLAGTETLSFQPKTAAYPGDRLRFTAQQGAYAPAFPFAESSPVAAPTDPAAALLDRTWQTSWATPRRDPSGDGSIHYLAQPKGSPLFGHDPLINPQTDALLGFMDTGYALPQTAGLAFPMPPYGGVQTGDGVTSFDRSQAQDFERQVIEPTRRQAIAAAQTPPSPSRAASLLKDRAAAGTFNATTPSGLIATVDAATGVWQAILLGQNLTPQPLRIQFIEPDSSLQQAFQTSQLFLVAANGVHLGAQTNTGSGAHFFNTMNVEDWLFAAEVGKTNRYGDYSNVMIVKGKKGTLTDLVQNPEQWTQRLELASPSTLDPQGQLLPPDPDQLVNLSLWLQEYVADAKKQASPYFAKFQAIVDDPNWTGILILKARVAEVPADLVGLTAGMDLSLFNVHHFGIEISPVDGKTVDVAGSSSTFGLIYYVDPAYDPEQALEPVAPPADTVYDFKVLTLKALFENTAVQDFESVSQITTNVLFGDKVDRMGAGGNPYNTLVLKGTYQNNDGRPVYTLTSVNGGAFYLSGNVLVKVEVTNVQLTTRDPGTESGTAVSWFGLSGFLDFQVLSETAGDETLTFDVFSFGNVAGQDLARRGLAFSNLGLRMSFPVAAPEQKTIVFDPGEIAFDVATSTPRPASLFVNFALELQKLTAGTAEASPKEQGFLPVATDFRLTGVEGGPWYGLSYNLSLGTPGDLAGKAGFSSALLTAWAPGGTDAGSYRAQAGLALPGTTGGGKLLSLETVLKLSIGDLRLTYVADQKSFLLTFTQIALKFLGLLSIPPNGATSFYLFGNPDAQGKPSGLGWYAVYNQNPPKTTGPTTGR